MTSTAGAMADIFRRDMGAAREALQAWLPTAMQRSDVAVGPVRATGGMSHEILQFDATWTQDGQPCHRAYIARIDPSAYRKRRESNLPREYAALTTLHRLGSVPVPRIHWYEQDCSVLGAAFLLMEKVSGQAGIDNPPYQQEGWLKDMPATGRRQVWETAIDVLARIHRSPAAEFHSLRRDPASGLDDFTEHLQHWQGAYQWAMEGHGNPVADAAWAWLLVNQPRNRPAGLSWGDARMSNLMFDGVRCTAALDWEDVSLSSPLFDIGRWLFANRFHAECGLPLLEGFGTRAETLARWEEYSGLSAAEADWYELFSICSGIGTLFRSERLQAEMAVGKIGPAKLSSAIFTQLITQMLEEAKAARR